MFRHLTVLDGDDKSKEPELKSSRWKFRQATPTPYDKSRVQSLTSLVYETPRSEFMSVKRFAKNHLLPAHRKSLNSGERALLDSSGRKTGSSASWKYFGGSSRANFEPDKSANSGDFATVRNRRTLRDNTNVQNIIPSVSVSGTLSSLGKPERRALSISALPATVSLSAILAQVRGGPLEKIAIRYPDRPHAQGAVDWASAIVDLFYWRPQDAERFFEYASTGMFVINGQAVRTDWADPDAEDAPTSTALELMADNGARRTLIFKKLVRKSAKQVAGYKGYPSPRSHFSDFDVDEATRDFERYGAIVEVAPVVSRKLCFSVQFFDVRSAIMAKADCENADGNNEYSPMFDKYKKWNVWYGRDPADKPCFSTC